MYGETPSTNIPTFDFLINLAVNDIVLSVL